jgi:hypothetical protein
MKPNDKQQDTGETTPSTEQRNNDLPDSARDQERLKPDKAILDLPDVNDIPGQEHIHPPSLGELADTTISSDDEEGGGLFGQERDEALKTGDKADDSYTLDAGNRNAEGNDATASIP